MAFFTALRHKNPLRERGEEDVMNEGKEKGTAAIIPQWCFSMCFGLAVQLRELRTARDPGPRETHEHI